MPLRRALDVLTLIVAVATIVYTAIAIPSLPTTIATHFGAAGRPDAYGPRETLWLAGGSILPVVALLWLVSRIPLEQMRTGGVRVTAQNRTRVASAMQQMLASVALFVALTGLWIVWTIVRSVKAGVWAGSSAELAVLLAVPFVLIAIYYVQVFTGSSERG
jgi:uncharacterized membrane protein